MLLVRERLARVFLAEEVEVGAADQIVWVVEPELLRERAADPDEAALVVLEVDVVRRVLHQRVEQIPVVH